MYLEHVNLTVSSLERSVRLYVEVFGLAVRWEGKATSGANMAHVGGDRFYLALYEGSESGTRRANDESPGLNHLGFVVEDLEAVRERLARFEIKPHAEMDYDPGRRFYFFDPDGIEVEVVES